MIILVTELQEKEVEEYKNHLIELINAEKNFEKSEKIDKISNLIIEKKSGSETIRNINGKFFDKFNFPSIVKFKSKNKLVTDITEEDRVLISDEMYPQKVLEGIVLEKKSKEIIVDYSSKKILEWRIPERSRIDLFVKESTYNRMIENLESRNIWVNYALHYFFNHLTPKNKNKMFRNISFFDKELNKSQKKAIEKSIRSENFFLIHGPFGTGKTKTLVEFIRQEVKLGNKLLVTADSNAAIDNIVLRLKDTDLDITRVGNDKKINKTIYNETLDFKSKQHILYNRIEENKKYIEDLYSDLEKYNPKKDFNVRNQIKIKIKNIHNKNNEIMDTIYNDIIQNSQVVLSTNVATSSKVLDDFIFDTVVIDEASQTTIPSVLIPISKAKKFILAGDHKQLPPTVLCENDELQETLFEKLLMNFPQQKQLLDTQYRMNKVLMDFPNREFYNNKLKCGENVKNIELNVIREKYDQKSPLIFIDTSNVKNNEEFFNLDSNSYINDLEAKLAIEISEEYIKLNIEKNRMGIITPYKDQVKNIKKKSKVEVNTVDGFQGNEKDIIIISTVRSNEDGKIGFINDPRRLNVTLTRAMKKLIIIGNVNNLEKDYLYGRLIEFCRQNKYIIKL